jgi:hypothetical protein
MGYKLIVLSHLHEMKTDHNIGHVPQEILLETDVFW